MTRKVPAVGPRNARLMLVGEAPGGEEELAGEPFVGAAGKELSAWLRAAGLKRDECFITNVCKYRPPGNKIEEWLKPAKKKEQPPEGWREIRGMWVSSEVAEGIFELMDEIVDVNPEVIVALGNTPLWALTEETGITKWRGSQLQLGNAALIPVLHPAAVIRQWAWRNRSIHDFKHRVVPSLAARGPVPAPKAAVSVNPPLDDLLRMLANLWTGQWVSVDLETEGGGIMCVGLAFEDTKGMRVAVVFDFAKYPANVGLVEALARALERAFVVGQSTTAYDVAYFDWKLNLPLRTDFDTYIAQSVLWPGEPRDLQHLASLYCKHYRAWKDYSGYEAKLETCARDVLSTLEIARTLDQRIDAAGLRAQFESRMRYAVKNVYPMARRGILRSKERTKAKIAEFDERLQELQLSVNEQVGRPINLRSPLQVKQALAELGVHVPSTGDDVLAAVKAKQPGDAPLLDAIIEFRSIASLKSNFLSAKPSPDGSLRSQISATGTETFRLTSGTDQFGGGANLLNITESLRTLIVPDPGFTYFNCDLARADLWAVVWEAEDEPLKRAMRDGIDMHLYNCCDLMDIEGIPYDEMFESHPRYPEHIERVGKRRKNSKQFVHLTNYGGKARTAGIACKMTVHEAEMAQRRWFALHPGIQEWHRRTMAQLRGTGRVRNVFGYHRPFLDRIESVLPEALAWVPQSTVALVASEIHSRFDETALVEVQMQCYDSVAGQYRTGAEAAALDGMDRAWRSVVVPYPDPFVIPLGLATSTDSWGACRTRPWPLS